MARNNLGLLLFRRGYLQEAEKQYLLGMSGGSEDALLKTNLDKLRKAMAKQGIPTMEERASQGEEKDDPEIDAGTATTFAEIE